MSASSARFRIGYLIKVPHQTFLDTAAKDPALEVVRSEDKATGEFRELPVDGCFVFIGYVPNSEALAGQVGLNERGEVITDEALRTDVPGVFAAGDVRTKRIRQVTTAVSDGTIAALTALEYLKSVA